MNSETHAKPGSSRSVSHTPTWIAPDVQIISTVSAFVQNIDFIAVVRWEKISNAFAERSSPWQRID